MKIKYLFLFLLLFNSCSSAEHSKEEIFSKERNKKIYSALKKFKHEMEKKGYCTAGIGEGVDPSTGKQNYLAVTFCIEQIPSIEFARKIEVDALQECLKYINEEEGIQDYVAEYPYPIKFLRVTFISKLQNIDLCTVSNFEAEISYCKDEPGKGLQAPSIEVHCETYDEAVQILERQQSCIVI